VRRDLDALKNNTFDLIIIGGGVSGSAIAWDASLRKMKVALIEKKDFGHATSAATSKLIHGGLRYLENFEFGVVRESLRERRLLERNIPHLAFPLPFILPVYDYLPISAFILRIGLLLYDMLSFDKNELPYSEKFLPNHQWISRDKILSLEPRMNARGLKGGFLYYDVINKFPERANMEYVLSAVQEGAVAANYVEFIDLVTNASKGTAQVTGVRVKDKPGGEEFEIKGKAVINAAGPWVDQILSHLFNNVRKQIIRSKGIHIIVPKVNQNCAITFSTRDKKHFFIIPWLDYTLLGTTDEKYTGDLDHVGVTKSEAETFLNLVKEYYPVSFGVSSIKHVYAGIRPLAVHADQKNTYAVSRKHEIINHRKTGQVRGLFSVIGGKWTTSRSLAESVVDKIISEMKFDFGKSSTAETPLIGGRFTGSFEKALYENTRKTNGMIDSSIAEHLFSYYGNETIKIMSRIKNNPKSGKIINKLFCHTLAEIEHAVEEESAQTLEDFVLRRSSIGNAGIPEMETLTEIADVMGSLLGWKKSEKENQIRQYIEKSKMQNE